MVTGSSTKIRMVYVPDTVCSGRGFKRVLAALYNNLHGDGTVGSRFATVLFTTIHFYVPCSVGPSTPDLWCNTIATQASFLYSVRL